MGKNTPTDTERAHQVYAGSFSGTGVGPWVTLRGAINLVLSGNFTGTVELDCSFDGGVTAIAELTPDGGQVQQFSQPQRVQIDEAEDGVVYRLRCTALTDGAIAWRFSA